MTIWPKSNLAKIASFGRFIGVSLIITCYFYPACLKRESQSAQAAQSAYRCLCSLSVMSGSSGWSPGAPLHQEPSSKRWEYQESPSLVRSFMKFFRLETPPLGVGRKGGLDGSGSNPQPVMMRDPPSARWIAGGAGGRKRPRPRVG